MKTAIIYYSKHHGNTKKLLDAIAEADESVVLIDVTKEKYADLSSFERIGLASGIYFTSYAKQVVSFAEAHLPENIDVFYIYTHGAPVGGFLKNIRRVVKKKNCRELGRYHCYGYDTVGWFKKIGGISKGHPTEKETAAAVKFYQSL
ncbi:MAG: flavodoxin [Clostridia bacterium]|nr:flavodoxin [Clostridia bacterium]